MDPKSRFLLEGDTLRIGFHGVGKTPYPEDIVPAGVLRALAQHTGVDLRTEGVFWGDYCFLAGVTGEAFRFLEVGGAATDVPLVGQYGHVTVDGMYRLALDAAGLSGDIHLRPHLPAYGVLRSAIVASLGERRTPVVGLGVFGPPEPFLITGYDEGGDVLLGWSHLQAEKTTDPDLSAEPSGQFRLRRWYDRVAGVVIVTGPKDRPPMREIYRAALERAVVELGTTGTARLPLGTAALERWAARLEDDHALAGLTQDLWTKAHSDHGATAGDLAERRALASSFLELACRFLPEARAVLDRAAAVFMASHDTVYEIWEAVAKTGPFDPDLDKFKDPRRRRSLAALVRRLAEQDELARVCLERVLEITASQTPGALPAPEPSLEGIVVLARSRAPEPAAVDWVPQTVALPNVMGMLESFLGQTPRDPEPPTHSRWMGLTGAAFSMPGDGPERSNLPLLFDALGYDYELWMSQRLAKETGLPCRIWWWDDNLRRRIFWNLRDHRLPVLLFGCGPDPDGWLVTDMVGPFGLRGYGGGPLDHPRNPLRPIYLMEGMKGKETWTIHLVARRDTPRPDTKEIYRRALAWGAARMSSPQLTVPDTSGADGVSTRTYHDWAALLEADTPAADTELARKRRVRLERRAAELAERRSQGAHFLASASRLLDRPELEKAAGHFRAVHALMTELRVPAGEGGVSDAGKRHAMAALLERVEAEDRAAAALL